jgi:hypothetical protein
VTAKFLVVPSKATRNVVVAERDITACSRAAAHLTLIEQYSVVLAMYPPVN